MLAPLQSRATGTLLLEASLLSMSIPSLYHELFGLSVTSREQGMVSEN